MSDRKERLSLLLEEMKDIDEKPRENIDQIEIIRLYGYVEFYQKYLNALRYRQNQD
jgi:hypothetical protein